MSGREHHDFQGRIGSSQLPAHVHAVLVGQVQVEQHHIGPELGGGRVGFGRSGSRAHYFDGGQRRQQHLQAGQQHAVVVYQQHFYLIHEQ
jgi:hypothetical protein